MKQIAKILSVMLAVCCLLAAVPFGNAVQFNDLNVNTLGQETFDAIMYVSDNGIMVGTGNGQFSPNMTMTRAQIVQVLFGHSGYSGPFYSVPFTDVSVNDWFYNAVSWANHAGIASGTSATTFSPNDTVNCEQTMSFLYRYATSYLNYDDTASSLPPNCYDLQNISWWALDAMTWAVDRGIIVPNFQGNDNHYYLHPLYNVPRKDTALYICRFDRRVIGFIDEKIVRYRNISADFFSGESALYKINNPTVKYRLFSLINAKFSNNESLAELIIGQINNMLGTSFNGACYGNAMVMLLDTHGRLDYNQFAGGYQDVYSVYLPKTHAQIRDTIMFYHLGQFALQTYLHNYLGGNISEGLADLETNVDKYGPTVFAFSGSKYSESSGWGIVKHIVIVEGVEKKADPENPGPGIIATDGYDLSVIEAPNPGPETQLGKRNTYHIFAIGTNYYLQYNNLTSWINLDLIALFDPYEDNFNNTAFLDLDGPYNNYSYNSLPY